ncbi:MAG: hypothetical protein ACI8XO_001164 [Verrucomicrobiales bacterium]|jgi:hypothetical protein
MRWARATNVAGEHVVDHCYNYTLVKNIFRFSYNRFHIPRGCQEISHTKMRRNFSQHQGRFQR